jgi:hypothetical protein
MMSAFTSPSVPPRPVTTPIQNKTADNIDRQDDGAQLALEACRREVKAAIEWFKNMRDAWRGTRSTAAAQGERVPSGIGSTSSAGRVHDEATVMKAPLTEAPPPAPSAGHARGDAPATKDSTSDAAPPATNAVEPGAQSTAMERARPASGRGVLAWLTRSLSRLTSVVRKSPLSLCVAPIAAYLVMGGLVCVM